MAIQPGYGGANPGRSGNDPRGRLQNESAYQKSRFENQQGPAVNNFAYQTGRSNEADYGNYSDIMNAYRNIYSNPAGGAGGDAGDGGGGGGYSAFTVSPGQASYKDPFNSYGGYQEFSQTGGYSPQDMANMRARSVSPIRAAYSNAEREIGRQRSLQGGYAPNAIATQAKMAREQGQSMADANTNVEAQLAQMRQQGRLAGLGGMSGIEGQRLGADVDLSKFNVGLDFEGQKYNAAAQQSAQAGNAGAAERSSAQNRADQLDALQGARLTYGTTPGMSSTFGDQLNQSVGQGGNFGVGMYGHDINAATRPGAYETGMGRATDITQMAGNVAYPWLNEGQQKRRQTGVPQQQQGYY